MTFIVGLMCIDGMVLCTDSLESDGFTKKSVGKIRAFGTTDWQVAISGAGSGGLIDKFCDEVSLATPRGIYDLKLIEAKIEDSLQDFRSRYPQDTIQVLVAIYCVSTIDRRLYRSEGGILSPQKDHSHTGVGHGLWRFLNALLYENGNSVIDNYRLAVFATRQAINYLEGVDDTIQLATYKFGARFWELKSAIEITAIESELDGAEFKQSIQNYWKLHNPPSHCDQLRKYKSIRTPGDELTFLDGVRLEELETISGRTRASKIFDRNKDRLQRRVNLERERSFGRMGS
jgi:hypothetical protein